MSKLSNDTKHDLKVVLAFCLTATAWIGIGEVLQWMGFMLIRHGHTVWASPLLIVSWLMILALLYFCLKISWDLWHGRTNVRDR